MLQTSDAVLHESIHLFEADIDGPPVPSTEPLPGGLSGRMLRSLGYGDLQRSRGEAGRRATQGHSVHPCLHGACGHDLCAEPEGGRGGHPIIAPFWDGTTGAIVAEASSTRLDGGTPCCHDTFAWIVQHGEGPPRCRPGRCTLRAWHAMMRTVGTAAWARSGWCVLSAC